MLTLNDGRNELWQWDTKRKLTVDADCSKVHFSNKILGRSIDVNVIDGIAVIPDFLLQTDKELTAWAFVGTPENGYTKISKVFKVNKRNKPADYVFTPPEQTSLEEIKEKLDYLESIQDPDAIKNAVEDYLDRNPVEAPVQSVNGKTGKIKLTAEDVGAISQNKLQEATNEALAQAKESGEFKGDPGEPGQPGDDYVLTDTDKTEIAELAAEMVEVPEGSGGGIAVTGATVGQTVKIAEVDENGVPTAWLPTDFPSGGGSAEWELLEDVDITERVWAIQVTNLNPSYTEILCIVDDLITVENDYTASVWANGVNINGAALKTFKADTQAMYRSANWCHCVLYGGYCLCYCATDVGTDSSAQCCKVSRGATYIGNFETFEIRSAHSSADFASGKIKIYAR